MALVKFWRRKPSVYAALATWGATGFMAQPTLASGVVHLAISPLMLAGVIWLAHHEGRAKQIEQDCVRSADAEGRARDTRTGGGLSGEDARGPAGPV